MTNYKNITVDTDLRGVATLTLNRPNKHNALNKSLISELRNATAKLGKDKTVRIVILTGAGESFCAGGDINWFADNLKSDREERIAESMQLAQMLFDLNNLPKPLIGRINGSAYGGGVGMMSVCDITVGIDQSNFGLTEVRLGLIPANISPYVVKRIGSANARTVMLSGALFNGKRALDLGLLTFCTTAKGLNAKIEDIVTSHLEAAPEAVRETKKLIEHVSSHNVHDNMIYTANKLADIWDTSEGKIGISCFLNKHRPPWRSAK